MIRPSLRRLALSMVLVMVCFSSAYADTVRDFTLSNGLKVIFAPVEDHDVIALQYVMPGTSLRQTEANAGIESLLLKTMVEGSQAFPKDVLRRELEKIGSYLIPDATRDASTLGLTCIRPFFARTLELYADVLSHPALDPAEFERLREAQLAEIRMKMDNPDSHLALVVNDAFFAGHPYHNELDGTEKSVSALKIADLKAHHERLLRGADSFLVVVGKLDKDELQKLLEPVFGKLPRNLLVGTGLPDFIPTENTLVTAERDQPAKFILGKFTAPAPNSPDYPALKVGMEILSYRFWEEVRTKKGLAYAVMAALGQNTKNYGAIYLSTTDETAALDTIYREIKRFLDTPVAADELTSTKAVHRTNFYMENESAMEQARFLTFGELYLGGYANRARIEEEIRAVRPSDIQTVAKHTMKNILFGVAGPLGSLNREAFTPFATLGHNGNGNKAP